MKNKKGMMKVSVGTIITVILLIAVVVLGIFFVQKILYRDKFEITQEVCYNETHLGLKYMDLIGSQFTVRFEDLDSSTSIKILKKGELELKFPLGGLEEYTKGDIENYFYEKGYLPKGESYQNFVEQYIPYVIGEYVNGYGWFPGNMDEEGFVKYVFNCGNDFNCKNMENFTYNKIMNITGEDIRIHDGVVKNLDINPKNVTVIYKSYIFQPILENKTEKVCEQKEVDEILFPKDSSFEDEYGHKVVGIVKEGLTERWLKENLECVNKISNFCTEWEIGDYTITKK